MLAPEDAFASFEAALLARAASVDHGRFAEVSVEVMNETGIARAVDPAALLAWAVTRRHLPRQVREENDFGQPAITVVRNDVFRVDVLYWAQNASAIHKHTTCGAFAALSGLRAHTRYDFEETARFGRDVSSGRLRRIEAELLDAGDAREVTADLIHALFWIDKPCVTLSVRCTRHPTSEQPRSYFAPGIACADASNLADAAVAKRGAGLGMLRRCDRSLYLETLREVAERGDALTVVHAVEEGAGEIDEDELRGLLLRAAHEREDGDLLRRLAEGVAHMGRRRRLERVYSPDPDVRLLAGLLWSGLSSAQVKDTMTARASGAFERALTRMRAEHRGVAPYLADFSRDDARPACAERSDS